MLSIASAAVQTRGDAVATRFAAAFARLEEVLAAERHQLILWAPVMLGAGVAAYFGLPRVGQWQAALCLGLAVAATGLATRSLVGRCLLWGGLLFAFGVGIGWVRAEMVAAPRLQRTMFARTFEATVVGVELQAAQERFRLLLRPADGSLPPRVRVSLRAAPPASVVPGAQIRLRATLQPPPGPSVPGGYDYRPTRLVRGDWCLGLRDRRGRAAAAGAAARRCAGLARRRPAPADAAFPRGDRWTGGRDRGGAGRRRPRRNHRGGDAGHAR